VNEDICFYCKKRESTYGCHGIGQGRIYDLMLCDKCHHRSKMGKIDTSGLEVYPDHEIDCIIRDIDENKG